MALLYNEQEQPTQGNRISKNLGTGLGEALHIMAQRRLANIERQEQYGRNSALLKAYNVPNHEQLGMASPEHFKEILKHAQGAEERRTFGDIARGAFGQQGGNNQQQSGYDQPQQNQGAGINIPQGAQLSKGSLHELANWNHQNKTLAQSQAQHEQKHGLKLTEQQRVANEAAAKWAAPAREAADASRKNIKSQDLIIELARSGNLKSGHAQVALDQLGLGDYNRGVVNELYKKEIARLGQGARAAYGPNTKLTNFLETTYQKSLSDLGNSPLGIESIANLNKQTDIVNTAKDEIQGKYLAQWQGNLPANRDHIIAKELEPIQAKAEKASFNIVYNTMEAEKKGKLNAKNRPPLTLPYATYDDGGPISENDIIKHFGKKYLRKGGEWKPLK